MKSATAFVLLAALTASAIAEPQEPPKSSELDRAFVTIPYSELRALWEAGQRKEPAVKVDAPPVSYVVHRAECELRLGERVSTLTAQFDVESLDANWQTVPLVGGAVNLEKADAGPRSVINEENQYALLTNQAGKTPVTLQMSTAGTKALTSQLPLTLKLGGATVKRLRISGIPGGMEARVNGRAASEVKDGVAIFSLPGGPGEVRIQIDAPRVEAAEAPPTPSVWQAQSQVLVRYGEGRLRYRSQVFAHANEGSGLEMTLEIPGNASSVAVEGPDLSDWTQKRSADGHRTLAVRWKTPDILDRELVVAYTTSQSPMADKWTLQVPASADQPEARNLYVIVPSDGLELKGDNVKAGMDSRRLPDWMRKEIGGSAFVTVEGEAQLALQTNWLPAMATAEAIVAESKCGLRLVADGSMQTTAIYSIRHSAPLAWQLELPSDVELLSCTVAGQSARPVQRKPGLIELNLAGPSDAAKGMTQVALVYTAASKRLDAVSGEAALQLPKTALFIERLDWAIEIPDQYEVTAVDGNATIVANAGDKAENRQLLLRKEFCRGDQPKVSLFYQRRSPQN
jgi:hypothetical protein